YVSASPFRVPIARLAARHAAVGGKKATKGNRKWGARGEGVTRLERARQAPRARGESGGWTAHPLRALAPLSAGSQQKALRLPSGAQACESGKGNKVRSCRKARSVRPDRSLSSRTKLLQTLGWVGSEAASTVRGGGGGACAVLVRLRGGRCEAHTS